MPVTIREVAKHLNLSFTTVSRALDGYDDVAEKTRRRVVRIARAMGYVPSRAARQLRRQRADAIGYVLPTSGQQFSDPFFSEFIAGLGDEAAVHSFDLLVSTARPGTSAERRTYQRWVQGGLVDGIILSRMRLRDWRVRYLVQNDFPFVAHGHTHLHLDYPYIEVDSRAGFALLVKHLVDRGHRRIAYIGAPRDVTLQSEHLGGYRDGLSSAGLAFDDTLVVAGALTRLGGYQGAQQLLALDPPPTAILGANDLTAIGAIRAAHERGLNVGRDVAIAGCDGTDDAQHTLPPLTTLKQPIYDIARSLVGMLLARLAGETLPQSHIILQPELIVRASTGA